MRRAPWGQRPLPPAAEAAAWAWDLVTPMDLTLSRRELRTRLRQVASTPGPQGDEVDHLLLAFEELASNGLRHGRAPVRVRVVCTTGGWIVDVTDAATDAPPTPAVGRDPAEGGLGLPLVQRLCSAHGWTVREGRKHVWACIRSSAHSSNQGRVIGTRPRPADAPGPPAPAR